MPGKLCSIDQCEVIHIPRFESTEGLLSVYDPSREYRIRRVFWIQDVPQGTTRGNHALLNTTQTFIAIRGFARLKLEDGAGPPERVDLRQWMGIRVQPMIWRTLECFEEGTVIMVLCNTRYDEEEYIRDKEQWKDLCQ